MELTISAPLNHLYAGRSKEVRTRMHSFIHSACKSFIETYYTTRSYKFRWGEWNFNMEQRKKLLQSMQTCGIITTYSKGFHFNDSVNKLSEVFAAPSMTSLVKFDSTVNVLSEYREGKKIKEVNDNDSKFLKRYVKHLGSMDVSVPFWQFRRIYNGNGLGGRLYSDYQMLPSEERAEISINGSSVVEIDFPSNHLRIIGSLAGVQNMENDLYGIFTRFDRSEIKKALNAVLNSKRPIQTLTSIQGNFRWSNDDSTEFIGLINKSYPFFESLNFKNDIGLRLQKFEGDVTMEILKTCLIKKIPCLPVHDAYIVRQEDESFIQQLMNEKWNYVLERDRAYLADCLFL